MIYSRSSEYAIRALVHLAQVPDGKYVMVKNIAEQEDIPAYYLAKTLQQLTRKGLLRSCKGAKEASPWESNPTRSVCWTLWNSWMAWHPTSNAPTGFPNATTTYSVRCTIAG